MYSKLAIIGPAHLQSLTSPYLLDSIFTQIKSRKYLKAKFQSLSKQIFSSNGSEISSHRPELCTAVVFFFQKPPWKIFPRRPTPKDHASYCFCRFANKSMPFSYLWMLAFCLVFCLWVVPLTNERLSTSQSVVRSVKLGHYQIKQSFR